MKISGTTVVITTYNQKESLVRSLQWLAHVSGISDIVIVDNGSTDGTSDLPEIRGGGIFTLTRASRVMEKRGTPL